MPFSTQGVDSCRGVFRKGPAMQPVCVSRHSVGGDLQRASNIPEGCFPASDITASILPQWLRCQGYGAYSESRHQYRYPNLKKLSPKQVTAELWRMRMLLSSVKLMSSGLTSETRKTGTGYGMHLIQKGNRSLPMSLAHERMKPVVASWHYFSHSLWVLLLPMTGALRT